MHAWILSGGRGTRLFPLTEDYPKPLLPLIHRPMIETLLQKVESAGIDSATILAGPMAARFAYLQRWASSKMPITVWAEPSPLGTAGAVITAQGEEPSSEPFLVLSGDGLFDLDLRGFVAKCRAAHAEVGILLAQASDPRGFGKVVTDAEGWVTHFEEKPPNANQPAWVNTGIYYLNPQVFRGLLPQQTYDFGLDLFPRWLEQGKRVFGVRDYGYWSDLGTLSQYHGGINDLMHGKVSAGPIGIPTSAKLAHRVPVGRPSWIADTAEVAEGVAIGPRTLLSARVRIAQNAVVQESIIRSGTVIHQGAQVIGAVIGEEVVIGAYARIEPGAVIGSHCRIEEDQRVPAGTVLSADGVRPGRFFAVAAELQMR